MPRPTILVVDDDANIVAAFAEFCRRESYEMFAAASVDEGKRQFSQHTVDILICDIRLKGQSGTELLRHTHESHPDVQLIVITGYPETIHLHELKEIGVRRVLLKPLDLDRLRTTVQECLAASSLLH